MITDSTDPAHETMGGVKIMFASLGEYGHLYPMMPLALAACNCRS